MNLTHSHECEPNMNLSFITTSNMSHMLLFIMTKRVFGHNFDHHFFNHQKNQELYHTNLRALSTLRGLRGAPEVVFPS